MRTTTRSDSGAVAVIVAICLVMLFTFAALAVDLGMWLTEKRQLQAAADAAALAGCRELSDGGGDSEVWAAARDYADRNFSAPVDAAEAFVVDPSAGGLSDIGDDYVKVTVRTASPSFFARVIGYDEGRIAAQSVAKIGYLAGANSPVPWGLTVLDVGEMSATMGGQTVQLWEAGGDRWAGAFSQGLYGPVTVSAENSTGYIEEFPGIVRVGGLPADGRISAVDVERTTFTSGVHHSCRVEVELASELGEGGTVTAECSGGKVTLTHDSDTGRYVGTVGVPSTSEPYENATLEIEVKEGKEKQAVSCELLVRRSNYILEDVAVRPVFAGPGDAVVIEVETLDFDYGVTYGIKVEGGAASSGNFLALDFAASSLDHSLCGYPDTPTDPGGHGASDYEEDIVGDPDLVVHLNDIVFTMTGNMVGPTTSGLDDRLAGVTMVSFGDWVAAGRPDTKQLLVVPITEKIEDITGKSRLKIIGFATFFLEEVPHGTQDPVVGRFVEYTAPGWVVVDDPPGSLAIRAVHLVSDHLDF